MNKLLDIQFKNYKTIHVEDPNSIKNYYEYKLFELYNI